MAGVNVRFGACRGAVLVLVAALLAGALLAAVGSAASTPALAGGCIAVPGEKGPDGDKGPQGDKGPPGLQLRLNDFAVSGLIVLLSLAGPFAFGIVIGWVTYRTLRRKGRAALDDIAAVLGTVGGAAAIAAFRPETGAFSAYCLGLLVGFFGYLWYARRIAGRANPQDVAVAPWLEEQPAVQTPAVQTPAAGGRQHPPIA